MHRLARHIFRNQYIFTLLISLTFLCLFLLLPCTIWEKSELASLDQRMVLRGIGRPRPEIVIIEIDERSILGYCDSDGNRVKGLGNYTSWTRDYHAELLQILKRFGARIVLFDIFFAEESHTAANKAERAAADRHLAESLKSFGKAGIALKISNAGARDPGSAVQREEWHFPQESLSKCAAFLGVVDLAFDKDNVIRRVRILRKFGDVSYPFLSYEGASAYSGEKVRTVYSSREVDEILSRLPSDEQGNICISFIGPPGTFPHYSFIDVLEAGRAGRPKNRALAGVFRDKLVLVGGTYELFHDEYPVPFRRIPGTPRERKMSGVEIHANIANMFLAGDFLREVKPVENNVVLALVILLSVSASVLSRKLWKGILLNLLLAGTAWVLAAYAFRASGIMAEIARPIGAIAFCFTGSLLVRLARSLDFTRRTLGDFSIREIEMQETLEKRVVAEGTIIFADIRGSTTMAEKISAELVMDVVNEFFEATSVAFRKNKGLIVEYRGDSLIVIFGAPEKDPCHALNAARSALMMQEILKSLNRKFEAEGKPAIESGIGIFTGELSLGFVGSHTRKQITILGDAVNVAARLQSLTSELKCPIIMGGPTFEQIRSDVEVDSFGPRTLKGRAGKVDIYGLLGLK
jgi:adenylate cyclase